MSQKIKTSVEIDGSLSASQIANATTDTDKFLVSDGGVIKYRTGTELATDLGISAGTTSKVQHQVKAGVAINKGQAVYVTGADGTNMIVGLASNATESTSSKTMGLLNATVNVNGFADVITEGLLDGLDTSSAVVGNPVWLGTGGNLIYGLANKPYAPAHLVFIGIVTRVNANNGEIFIKVQNGFELEELHNVDLQTTTPINGHLLGYNGTLWVNKTIAGWLGYTPADDSSVVHLTGSEIITGSKSFFTSYSTAVTILNSNSSFSGQRIQNNGTHSGLLVENTSTGIGIDINSGVSTGKAINHSSGAFLSYLGNWTANSFIKIGGTSSQFLKADGSVDSNSYYLASNPNGYISSYTETDPTVPSHVKSITTTEKSNWNTAYGWGNHASAGYVPQARTITINGASYDLSANRSWTVTASETDTLATVVSRGDITNGGRPIRLDSSGGGVSIRGSVGGWATGYYFMGGTSNTYRGGFGALGSDDSLSNYWIGPAYNGYYTYIDSSQMSHTSSVRGPIFYDSNDTGYYVDPASTSNLNLLTMANKITLGSFANSTVNSGSAWIGRATDRSNGTMTVQLGSATSTKFEVVDYAWTTVAFEANGYGTATASSSFRAPAFYDSNDTTYYADLAATSQEAVRQRGGTLHGPNTTWGAYLLVGGNGRTSYIDNTLTASVCATDGNIHLDAGSGKNMYLNWYDGSSIIFGNGAESQIAYMSSAGDFTANSSSRSPIFYDSNDTAYYTNPASTSNLNAVNLQGLLQVAGTSGNYNEGMRLVSGTGSWSNIQFGANMTGAGTQANQWIVGKRPDGNFVMSLAGNQDGGSRFLIQQDGRVQSPTYYDGNDTGFYLDPNGTSNLDTINAARFASRMGSQSPDNSHPGYGIRPFYSWNIGQAYNATAGYSNGITIGSHPGDQAYGFQLVQNMWDDQLYFRRYNGGWQGWRMALDNNNYSSFCNFGGNSLYAGIFYDGNNTGYYIDPAGNSQVSAIYANNWFRAQGNTGLYGQDYGVHFYPQTASAWSITGSGGNVELQFRANHNSTIYGYVYADTSSNIGFLTSGGGWRFRCDNSGNAIATGDVTAYSDRRVKENIHTIDNALDKVNNLRGVYYTRIDSEDKQRKVGVIAQETLEVLPEVVGKDTDGMYNVAYGNITAVLIEAIKEQQTQIEELKQLVNKLINK